MPLPGTVRTALALLVVLVVAGCGGAEEPTDRSAGATSPATTAEPPGAPQGGVPPDTAPGGAAREEQGSGAPAPTTQEEPPASTPGGGPPPEEPRAQLEGGGACGQVAFTPQSDNGAFAIQARGVDCATARQVAAGAEGRQGGAYSAAGFSCRSTGTTGGPLPAQRYRCEGGSSGVITFEAG